MSATFEEARFEATRFEETRFEATRFDTIERQNSRRQMPTGGTSMPEAGIAASPAVEPWAGRLSG